jgi:predicted DNA-binding protein with PD1-like motif
MNVILQDNNISLLRFDKGEDVFTELSSFTERKHIMAAVFTALGAAGAVTLSYYDLIKKEYIDRDLKEDLEIVTVTGNIGRMDEKQIVHAHGIFSNRDMQTFGGHIKKIIVSATCEVTLTKLEGNITRGFDEETGLNLMK